MDVCLCEEGEEKEEKVLYTYSNVSDANLTSIPFYTIEQMFNQQIFTLPLNYSIGQNQKSQAEFGPEGATKLTACRLNRDLQSVS